MGAIGLFLRPVLAGGLAFGLAFLGHGLSVAAWAPRAMGLPWLILLLPGLQEAAKFAVLHLAGGVPRWVWLGFVFGGCEAVLRLLRPDPSLAGAVGAMLLHAALGGLAAALARRSGWRTAGFALAWCLHGLASLATSIAGLALARRHGLPIDLATDYVGLALATALALLAWRYSAASRSAGVAFMPKASASSR